MTTDEMEAPVQDKAAPAEQQATAAPAAVKYSVSAALVRFLHEQKVSFCFTSYESGKLYMVGLNPAGGITVNERFFRKAMGIAVSDRNRLHVATLAQLIRFENTLDDGKYINSTYDACYVPREIRTLGDLNMHDIGVLDSGEVVFVNTRFNCLATASDTRSFRPIWKPPFIDTIIDEDRCHLNGLAMEKGKPRYVTAVSKSNTIDGWRDRRADGGIVIDIKTGKTVCEGLSMPHSPRLHNGKLWLLNSGSGELGTVDRKKGTFNPVAFCPGFTRGLSFHGRYAFVGLSRPRYERFVGLDLDNRLKDADSEPWCGVQVIDTETGACLHWLRIDGLVAELYDTAVLPNVRTPMSLGFSNDDVATLIVPEEMGADAPAKG